MKIRIGSRDSVLAVRQSEIVIDLIKKFDNNIEIELITMKTTGDKILDRSLQKIGGKGLFVKELDRALLDNEVDLTVHSLKDMPMNPDDTLPLVAFINREDCRDALVLPKGQNELDFSKNIGSSSSRRSFIFKNLYNEATVSPVRGNVLTRLEKLDNGEFSALILASAGLKRLGLEDRISKTFEPFEMIPAAGQGIIVVQARKGFNADFLKHINDKQTEFSAETEREFVRFLEGGCTLPIGAYATIHNENVHLSAFYYNEHTEKHAKGEILGQISDRINLARELAIKLKEETL